jgi:hypothetical protein
MATLLFVVEDTFAIPGRGLLLTPGIIPGGKVILRAGDRIRMRRPDGKTTDSTISSNECLMSAPHNNASYLVFNELTKDDVPIGTEIWSIDKT